MSKLNQDRFNRVLRTLKQAAQALVLTAAVALLGTLTNVVQVEYGTEVWFPVFTAVATVVASYVRNLRDQKKENGGQDTN
jgi:3'-phosphoadenosine 5'-phosphosulfate sulfotransferase